MRDCANCFHRKPVLKEDGTWTAECEKWDCEFQSRENMIEKTKAMNNDLISRSALKEAIEQWFIKDKYYTGSKHRTIPKDELLDVIDNAPPVAESCKELQEVASERPKGEWKIMSDRYGQYYACSVCGYDRSYSYTFNFCPNCGADMRGEDNGRYQGKLL